MKIFPSILLAVFFLACLTDIHAQATLILQPGPEEGKDAEVYSVVPDKPLYPTDLLRANAWTFQRRFGVERGLLQFDLSSIPPGATITNATLTLFAPESGHSQFHSGDNTTFISRITSPWVEDSVTWNTQPSFTTHHQVVLPNSQHPYHDYQDIEVTALVQDMVHDPQGSFGFMLRLQRERHYRRLSFCSSDYTDPAKHPRLVIEYLPTACDFEVLQPGAGGKDAEIFSLFPHQTLNGENFRGNAWTFQNAFGIERGLLQFDLSHIPSNAYVHAAFLTLYALDEPNSQFHSGDNTATLRRITSPWEETTVNWSNQPATTPKNKVVLASSVSAYQDYDYIPVTDMVRDMVADPSHSFGFMLQLQTEKLYRRLSFASGDSPNPARHPKLEICYTIPETIAPPGQEDHTHFVLFPNPVEDILFYQFTGDPARRLHMRIYDPFGRLVQHHVLTEDGIVSLNELPDQMYWVNIVDEQGEIIRTTSFIKSSR